MKKVRFDRLAGGAAWNIAGKVVQTVVTLATLVVIARMVGPQAYGVFALTWITVGLIEIFAMMAPIDTLVQRRELKPGHLNATFWASLVAGVLGLACLTFTAESVAELLEGGTMLAEILPARAATLPLGALAVVPIALLMRVARFKAIAAVESSASVAASIVGLAFAFGGAGVWSLVAMELTRSVATAASAFVLARWTPGIRMRQSDFTDLLGFNASTWGAWGITYLDDELPRALIARSLGPVAVGLYSMAMRLFDQVVTLLIRPAYQVVQTGAARAQDDPAMVGELAHGTMRASVVLAAPLFLGIAAISPVLIPAVFGSEWVGAVPVIQVMMLFAIRSPVPMVQMAVLRGMGKANWHMGIAAVGVCITIVVLAVSLPYGLVAVAAAIGAQGALLFPLHAWLVRRLTGLSVFAQLTAGFGASVAAAVMAVAVWGALSWLEGTVGPVVALAIAVPGGAILYWAVLRVFSRSAARVVDAVVFALARRDIAAARAALQDPVSPAAPPSPAAAANPTASTGPATPHTGVGSA
ncbi:MAG: lipopolysaccharide biosynthesis protein [Burkholderiaceae bacterium]